MVLYNFFFLFDEAEIKSEIRNLKCKVQPQPKFSNFMISSDEKKKVEKLSTVQFCTAKSLQLFSCQTRKQEFKQYGEPLNPHFVVMWSQLCIERHELNFSRQKKKMQINKSQHHFLWSTNLGTTKTWNIKIHSQFEVSWAPTWRAHVQLKLLVWQLLKMIVLKIEGTFLTVSIGQNVAFISPKMLAGDSKRKKPKRT